MPSGDSACSARLAATQVLCSVANQRRASSSQGRSARQRAAARVRRRNAGTRRVAAHRAASGRLRIAGLAEERLRRDVDVALRQPRDQGPDGKAVLLHDERLAGVHRGGQEPRVLGRERSREVVAQRTPLALSRRLERDGGVGHGCSFVARVSTLRAHSTCSAATSIGMPALSWSSSTAVDEVRTSVMAARRSPAGEVGSIPLPVRALASAACLACHRRCRSSRPRGEASWLRAIGIWRAMAANWSGQQRGRLLERARVGLERGELGVVAEHHRGQRPAAPPWSGSTGRPWPPRPPRAGRRRARTPTPDGRRPPGRPRPARCGLGCRACGPLAGSPAPRS